ncbi:hypothetical protein MMC31_001360 [Peltigera leucophlebia]|nr:hypothetical protein [Peltigera leucophlebia]
MDSVVANSTPIQEMSSLDQQIQRAISDLSAPKGAIEEDSRKLTLSLAKKLVIALEKPEDVAMRYIIEVGAQCTCLRLGVDLRLFHVLVEHEGVPVSASQLAELSKTELLLIVRIMRVISSIGFAVELDEQTYMATALTKTITNPALEGGMKICYDQFIPVQVKMLDYFRVHGYKSPIDNLNCPFQLTLATHLPFYEHLRQSPEKFKDFNTFMEGNRGGRKHWIDWFPVESHILSAIPSAENDTLLVDVGGGKGHDLERFLSKYPQTKGRLVLQDLPSTINSIQQLSPDIRPMSHDFFTPQPVKGARVYYTHFVLHNWPDAQCRIFLQNLMPAMKVGYSKILLNELILPKTNYDSWIAAVDIHMMSLFAGMERTRQQWIDLLQSVGLEVVGIWSSPYDGEENSIIEAMLKA